MAPDPAAHAPDVLLDVSHNLTLYRVKGVWRWSPPERALSAVMDELEAACKHTEVRGGVMAEALLALQARVKP